MKLVTPLFVLVAITVATAPLSASRPLCQPDADTRKVLDAVGTENEIAKLSQEAWTERLEVLEAALRERPDDLHLHRHLQNLVRVQAKGFGQTKREELVARYRALRTEHPDEAMYHYLYGRLTDDLEEGLQAAVAAVEADPQFPWGHLALAVEIIRNRLYEDGQEEEHSAGDGETTATEHLARFYELCPDRLYETLLYSSYLGEDSWWREQLPNFRDRIRQDPELHLLALPQLWGLDFRLSEPARYNEVRQRVEQDLLLVEGLGSEKEAVLDVLQEGYELAGLEEKAAELEAQRRKASPCSHDAVSALLEELGDEQADTTDDSSDRAVAEAARARVAKTGAWVERCPNEVLLWFAHLSALDDVEDSPPEAILAAGEQIADLYGRWNGSSFPSGYTRVAQVLVDRDLAPDRALELLGLAEKEAMAERESEKQLLERLPEAQRRQIELSNIYSGLVRDLLVARAQVAAGKTAEARRSLDKIRNRLEELEPTSEADGREIMAHGALERAYWSARADLAEENGRSADALAYLLRALGAPQPDSAAWLGGPPRDDVRARALALWSGLGGGPESFGVLERSASGLAGQQLSDESIAEISPWTRGSEPLPPFDLTDLSGTRWSSDTLRGKAVFVNAWATWCGPCRNELPLIQTLHERLTDRDDLLVVTLNKDANPGLIARMLRKKGYSFPVLLAHDYLSEEAKVFSIPQSWILAPDGTVLYEQIGFSAGVDEEEWLADVEQRLKEASEAPGG